MYGDPAHGHRRQYTTVTAQHCINDWAKRQYEKAITTQDPPAIIRTLRGKFRQALQAGVDLACALRLRDP